VPQADKGNFYLNLPSVMKYNNVRPRFSSVATTNEMILRDTIEEFGASNERDRSNELSPSRYSFYNSNDIVNAVGVESTHYLFREGHIGVLNWIDPDARRGERIHESKFWDSFVDPVFGCDWGVYYSADCGDASAELAGLQRTKVEGWEFTADFAFITAVPNNLTAGDNAIYKFEILL
jgi:hypothetical protein